MPTPKIDDDFRKPRQLRNRLKKSKRIVVLNFWKTLVDDLQHCPLGICLPKSVDEKDLIFTPLDNYNDSGVDGHSIYVAMNSDTHKWYFLPKMKVDETLVFKTYDSNNGFTPP